MGSDNGGGSFFFSLPGQKGAESRQFIIGQQDL